MSEKKLPWSAVRTLDSAEKLDWLRLIRSHRVGPITFFRLMERFGSARVVLENLPELARQGGSGNYSVHPENRAMAELERVHAVGARLIAWCEPEYPARLRETEDAPPLLSAMGQTDILQRRMVAIVGARNASVNGLGFARSLARDLGQNSDVNSTGNRIAVVSGMARGIDAAAHHGSLEQGTVAVLGGGVDVVYPADNARLYDEISEKGTIVAEMPVGTRISGHLFPVRNRLISGMADGIVVVEAAPRSGSLITARLALEQGRDVFAVPGSPGDSRARGANGLIKSGAILTESAEDIFNALGQSNAPASRTSPAPPFPILSESMAPGNEQIMETETDAARTAITELLGNSPVAVDELVRNCQFSSPMVSAVLLEMELAGRLERHPGNRVCQIIEHKQARKRSLP